jgi:phage regulator Rha-like protein
MAKQLELNSLELAAELAEPHHQVLQCVDGLIADGMERSRFRETRYLDTAGVERRCVEMTQEAVVLVSMRLGGKLLLSNLTKSHSLLVAGTAGRARSADRAFGFP